MSGSPKYHTVNSGEQRRRQAEQARREREQRRREQERQRQAAALERARQNALQRAAELAKRFTVLRQEAAAAGLADAGGPAAARLAQAEQAVRAAQDKKAVATAALDVEQTERALAGLRHEIDAHRRQVATDRVEAVARQLAEVPAEVRRQYDGVGADEVDELLTVARRYASKAPGKSDNRVEAAADAVREHLDKVLGRRAEHESLVAGAVQAVSEAHDRLTLLRSDAEQARIPLPGAEEIGTRIEELASAVRLGDAERALAAVPEVTHLLDRAEAGLDGHIDRVVERRELLNSIIRALPEAGFAVDRNSYVQRDDGAMELRAGSTAGQQFAVLLRDGAETGTEVLYTTDTMAEAVVAGNGQGGQCGPLLSIIGRLSDEARRDGFEPGTVHWDDGDDDQPPPGASVRQPAPSRRRAG